MKTAAWKRIGLLVLVFWRAGSINAWAQRQVQVEDLTVPRRTIGIQVETLAAVSEASPSTPERPPSLTEYSPGNYLVSVAMPSLLVTRIVTDSSEILSAQEIQNLVAGYEHKQVTQAELAELIDKFNRLYAAKGFTTARAVLPAQTVHDGVVKIRLIEGRVGRVVVQKNTHTRDSYFLDRVPANSGEILRLQELQSALAYFNVTNDLKLHAILQPGEQFGSTDVMLQVDGPSDFEVTTFFDNAGRDTIGLYRGGVNVTYRSLFGNRDSLAVGFLGANGTLGGVGSYSVPLDTRGTKLGALFNYNTIAVNGGVLGSTGMVGHSYDAALRLSRPLLVRPNNIVSASLSAHYKTSLLSSEGFPLSRTLVRSLELATDFQRFDAHGAWFATNILNGGFDNLNGGFFRYNGSLMRSLVFSPSIMAIFRASGQANAFNSLVPIEQMQIGGVATVRGYPEAALIGDRGYVVTGELDFPFLPNAWAKKRIKMAAFVDNGAVFDKSFNGSNLPRDTQLLSSGFGFVFNLPAHISGRVDFGVPLRNKTGISDVGVHFYLQSNFGFPRQRPAATTSLGRATGQGE